MVSDIPQRSHLERHSQGSFLLRAYDLSILRLRARRRSYVTLFCGPSPPFVSSHRFLQRSFFVLRVEHLSSRKSRSGRGPRRWACPFKTPPGRRASLSSFLRLRRSVPFFCFLGWLMFAFCLTAASATAQGRCVATDKDVLLTLNCGTLRTTPREGSEWPLYQIALIYGRFWWDSSLYYIQRRERHS